MQQTGSSIISAFFGFVFLPPGEIKSNIPFPFRSELVYTNTWVNYLTL